MSSDESIVCTETVVYVSSTFWTGQRAEVSARSAARTVLDVQVSTRQAQRTRLVRRSCSVETLHLEVHGKTKSTREFLKLYRNFKSWNIEYVSYQSELEKSVTQVSAMII